MSMWCSLPDKQEQKHWTDHLQTRRTAGTHLTPPMQSEPNPHFVFLSDSVSFPFSPTHSSCSPKPGSLSFTRTAFGETVSWCAGFEARSYCRKGKPGHTNVLSPWEMVSPSTAIHSFTHSRAFLSPLSRAFPNWILQQIKKMAPKIARENTPDMILFPLMFGFCLILALRTKAGVWGFHSSPWCLLSWAERDSKLFKSQEHKELTRASWHPQSTPGLLLPYGYHLVYLQPK